MHTDITNEVSLSIYEFQGRRAEAYRKFENELVQEVGGCFIGIRKRYSLALIWKFL
jgi:hypothetical protein